MAFMHERLYRQTHEKSKEVKDNRWDEEKRWKAKGSPFEIWMVNNLSMPFSRLLTRLFHFLYLTSLNVIFTVSEFRTTCQQGKWIPWSDIQGNVINFVQAYKNSSRIMQGIWMRLKLCRHVWVKHASHAFISIILKSWLVFWCLDRFRASKANH